MSRKRSLAQSECTHALPMNLVNKSTGNVTSLRNMKTDITDFKNISTGTWIALQTRGIRIKRISNNSTKLYDILFKLDWNAMRLHPNNSFGLHILRIQKFLQLETDKAGVKCHIYKANQRDSYFEMQVIYPTLIGSKKMDDIKTWSGRLVYNEIEQQENVVLIEMNGPSREDANVCEEVWYYVGGSDDFVWDLGKGANGQTSYWLTKNMDFYLPRSISMVIAEYTNGINDGNWPAIEEVWNEMYLE